MKSTQDSISGTGQVRGTRAIFSLKQLGEAFKSDVVFGSKEVERKVLILGRIGLVISILIAPIILLQPYFFLEPIGQTFSLPVFGLFITTMLLGILLAYEGEFRSLVYGNMILALGILISWIIAVEYSASHHMHFNYTATLPLLSFLFIQNVVLFLLRPFVSMMIGVAFVLVVVALPYFHDHEAFMAQSYAFTIFAIACVFIWAFIFAFQNLLLALAQNIGDHERAKKEAVEARQMLREAVLGTPLGIIAFDADGKLLIRKNVDKLMPDHFKIENEEGFVQEFYKEFDVWIDGTDCKNIEVSHDGHYFMIVPKFNPKMSIYALIDLTERQEWEKSARQNQKMSLIGQIASGVAHDYNNVLAIAINNIEAISKDKYNDLWHENLNDTIMSLEHAKAVSHRLLSLSGRKKYSSDVFDVSKKFTEMRTILRSAVPSHIELIADTEPNCLVRADSQEFEGVLLNLVLNAVHAIGEDNGRIEIYALKKGRDYCEIRVCDNGPGIPKSDQAKIFEPFFTTRKSQYFTGLGLSLAKKYCEQFGGEIRVQSVPKRTTFTIKLPLVKELSDKFEAVQNYTPFAGEKNLKKILLVDDNKDVLFATTRMVELNGIQCLCTTRGAEACDIAREHKDLQVAFLDLSMPEQDGISLGEQLMKINPNIKCFILTGDASSEHVHKAKTLGFKDVLYKPMPVKDLLECANNSLYLN